MYKLGANNRLLIIGLDGADYQLTRSLLSEGSMPNLERLISRGCFGKLVSTIPPATPVAWRSLASGVNPGKHGVFGFMHMDREHRRLETTMLHKDRNLKLWHILDEMGWRVGVLNFPYYFPPDEVGSFFVSGFGAPEDGGFCYPEALKEELGNEYRVQYRTRADLDPEGFKAEIRDIVHQRLEAALGLMRNHSLDAVWVTFMALDWVQHHFWEDRAVIREFHQLIDEVVGHLLDEPGWQDARILIVSDHGFDAVGSEIRLNVALRDWGYLRLRKGVAAARSRVFQLALTFNRAMRKLGIDLRGLVPEEQISQAMEIRPSFVSRVDWSRTTAYSMGYLGDIWLEEVDPENNDRLAETLRRRLLDLRDPKTGDPVIEEVISGQELYNGPCAEKAPDLVALPSENGPRYVFNCWELEDAHWLGECLKTADHAPSGIFVFTGDGFQASSDVGELRIVDVLPTLLYALNLPIPTDVDGQIELRVFDSKKLADSKPQYLDYSLVPEGQGELTAREEAEMLGRLKGLGYVE